MVSSDLLETELRRIGVRHRIDQVLITSILAEAARAHGLAVIAPE
ncbi:hypothetical protein [Brevibacterium album]|nr:hypothetical protein [Brevibacterium album]